MNKKNYVNYIFDFDGTIVDLNIDWVCLKKEINRLCRSFQINTDVALNIKIDQLKDKESNIFHILRKYEQPYGIPSYDVVRTTLNFIKTIDLFYVVSSNLNATVHEALKKVGVRSKCVAIVGIDDVKNSKPDIDAFTKLLPELKEGLSIYIGDKSLDEKFAQNCGISFKHVGDI